MLGAPAQLPDDGSQRLSRKSGTDADDRHSEAGTYTIDDEEDDAIKQSVQQARERIDDVFGIRDGMENKTVDASGYLVRPVIESERHRQDQSGSMDIDEDVFTEADDVQHQHYVCIVPIDSNVSVTLLSFRH